MRHPCRETVREWLKDRRGVGAFKTALPEPATRQAILDPYAKAIGETPRLELILLTHPSHRTGLVIPVKEIAAMAREKNIDVILGRRAFMRAQLNFEIADLGVDFIGFSLAKMNRGAVGRDNLVLTAVSGATPPIMAARSNCVRRSKRRRHTSCGLISPHAAANY